MVVGPIIFRYEVVFKLRHRRGQGFCDDSIQDLLQKIETIRGGGHKLLTIVRRHSWATPSRESLFLDVPFHSR